MMIVRLRLGGRNDIDIVVGRGILDAPPRVSVNNNRKKKPGRAGLLFTRILCNNLIAVIHVHFNKIYAVRNLKN